MKLRVIAIAAAKNMWYVGSNCFQAQEVSLAFLWCIDEG
jgi:hypothetical protein